MNMGAGSVNSQQQRAPDQQASSSTSSTGTTGQAMGRKVCEVPAKKQKTSHTFQPEWEKNCSICREPIDLSKRDIKKTTKTPCNHFFHASCLEGIVKNKQQTANEPFLNPQLLDCPNCRKKIPASTPQWDGKGFVCKVRKDELESPVPYVGVPVTLCFPSLSDQNKLCYLTIALGFQGAPWLHAYEPVDEVTGAYKDNTLLPFRATLKDQIRISSKGVCGCGDSLQGLACFYEVLLNECGVEKELKDQLTEQFHAMLRERSEQGVRLMSEMSFIQFADDNPIRALNYPLYSMGWCNQVLQPTSDEAAPVMEPSTNPPPLGSISKCSDKVKLRITITDKDKATIAVLSGITFNPRNPKRSVFKDGIIGDAELRATEEYREYKQAVMEKVESMAPDDSLYIRVELLPPDTANTNQAAASTPVTGDQGLSSQEQASGGGTPDSDKLTLN